MTVLQSHRVAGIDILRGLVMIIMALDHTRDFFHVTAVIHNPLDYETTTAPLFFTRWITHFCAPVFVFLSGLSVYLSSLKKTPQQTSAFVIKRGVWLVLVELVIVTFGITFDPLYRFIILQVIWAIGWSMIILGILMRLGDKVILFTGLILFFGHNVVDYISIPQSGIAGALWATVISSRTYIIPVGANHIIGVIYAILPWTGIMLIGYSIGKWYRADYNAALRKRNLLLAGFALTLIFVVLRFARGYGDPGTWQPGIHSIYSFFNTSKYPPSLQYAGMTLGPALILLAFIDQVQNRWSALATVYGRVPFFYYILHFYLLHLLLMAVFFIKGFKTSEILNPDVGIAFRPVVFGYELPGVYLIWLLVVVALYYPCKWFHQYKMSHTQWWLKYL